MKPTLSLAALLLTLAAVPAPAQTPEPRTLSIGQVVTGQLDASDPTLPDGAQHYDTWTFQARAGQLLVISMGSDDFDTLLTVGQMVGGEFREIDSGDDALGTTDSSVELPVRQDGTYVIHATSFSRGETGPYTLVVFDAR
jgi:hypothetical protein